MSLAGWGFFLLMILLALVPGRVAADTAPELGLLMAVGRNANGQLGDGTTIRRLTPVQVSDAVADVSAGREHTLFLKTDGTLWAVGSNARGQLGNVGTTSQSVPIMVAAGVTRIAAGSQFSLFIKSDRTLWAMGFNSNGQLGDGTQINRSSPTLISANVAEVAAGSSHTLFVKTDGTLWAMGSNQSGLLGDGTFTQRLSPVPVASGVVNVACGWGHSLFLKTDGSVWAMGYNADGQLGDSSITYSNVPVRVAEDAAAIAAGDRHSLVLKTDGTLWGMGYNFSGQLGIGTNVSQSTPAQITSGVERIAAGSSGNHTLFLRENGELWGMGSNLDGQLGDGTTVSRNSPILIARGVTRMTAGGGHSHFIQNKGRLAITLLPNPVVTAGATWSITPAPAAYASGQAVSLPVGGYTVSFAEVESYQVPAPMTVEVLPGQLTSASAAYTGGPVPTLSLSENGQDIGPSAPPLTFQNSLTAPDASRQLTVSNSGNVTISGIAVRFEGSGAYTFSILPNAPFSLAPGESASLEVVFSGTPFGGNFPAALVVTATGLPEPLISLPLEGTGVPRQGNVSVTLEPASARNAGAGWSIDDGLTWHSSGTSVSIPCGPHAIIFSEIAGHDSPKPLFLEVPPDGTISRTDAYTPLASSQMMVTGPNFFGELGTAPVYPGFIGPVSQVAASVAHAFMVGTDGTLWGSGNDVGSLFGRGLEVAVFNPPVQGFESTPVILQNHVRQVAAGRAHTLYITTDGELWGMGANNYSQLGRAPLGAPSFWSPIQVATSVTQAAAGGIHSLFIKTDGSLWALGGNNLGQIGADTTAPFYQNPVQIATDVRQVVAGDNHTLFLRNDGTLWAAGNNTYGQLGDGTTTLRRGPVLIASGVVHAATSDHHTLFVREDGTLWGVGRNDQGQLGTGHTQQVPAPVQVSTGVVKVSTSLSHSLFVKQDGSLWAMGDNTRGQLGDGTGTARLSPVKVADGVSTGEAGYRYSLVVRTDGTYFALGTGMSNELTLLPVTPGTDYQPVTTPVEAASDVMEVAAGEKHTLFIKADGSLWTTDFGPTPRLLAVDVKAAAAGAAHSLFIKSDDSLWAVGDNAHGQLGDGTRTTRIEPVWIADSVSHVAAGTRHSLFVKSDGSLWAMGSGLTVFGGGTTTTHLVPVEVAAGVSFAAAGGGSSFFIKTDGSLWATGSNSDGQLGTGDRFNVTAPVQVATGVIQVATSPAGPNALHSHFVKQDGSLWAMGGNASGALGEGPATDITTPIKVADGVRMVAAGGGFSHFIKTDGSLWATGNNYYGSLGDGTTTDRHAPVKIAENVRRVAAGFRHSVFIVDDRAARLAVSCDSVFARAAGARWTADDGATWHSMEAMPALEPGDYTIRFSPAEGFVTPAPVPVSITDQQIHRIRVDYVRVPDTGLRQLMVMGSNDHGQLGLGAIQRIGPEGVSKVSSSAFHTLMVKRDGSLWAMGRNASGQLGDGTTSDRTTPVQILPGGVRSAAAGSQHSLVLMADGRLFAMGANNYGQLGDGSNQGRPTPVHVADGVVDITAGDQHSLFVRSDGSLWSMGHASNGQLGDGTSGWGVSRNVPLQVASDVRQVAAGSAHSLFVKTDGTLWAMGSNSSGQLGDGTAIAKATPIWISSSVLRVHAGGSTSFYVNSDQKVYAMGYNQHGQLGEQQASGVGRSSPVRVLKNVTGQVSDIAPAGDHTLFLMVDGRVFTVGDNRQGQLGNGVSTNVESLTPEPTEVAAGAIAVAAAHDHSLLVKLDGTLWGMGENSFGLLAGRPTVPLRIARGVVTAAAGMSHSIFLDENRRLWGTGTATDGQLGYDPFTTTVLGAGSEQDRLTPRMVGTDAGIGVSKLSAGFWHSHRILEDGSLLSMGDNAFGQLGNGSTSDSHYERIASNVIDVVAGGTHSLFLKDDGSLWAVGRNHAGQLGDGTQTNRSIAVRIASEVRCIAAGGSHSLFVKADGSLWAMGGNASGQLGNGGTAASATPVHVTGDVVDVAAGENHSLFIKSNGTLWGMGSNSEGQLGHSGGQSAGIIPAPVLLATGVTSASGGGRHTLYATADGILWGLGGNSYGQVTGAASVPVGVPTQVARHVVDFEAGTYHSLFISNDPAYDSPPTPLDRLLSHIADAGLTGERAGPLAEPHSDGVPNLLKYAFNLQLHRADSTVLEPGGLSGLPRISIQRNGGQGIFRIEYLRRKGAGLTYTATYSPSLSAGSFTAINGETQVQPIDEEWERIIVEKPVDFEEVPKLFARVEVALEPR